MTLIHPKRAETGARCAVVSLRMGSSALRELPSDRPDPTTPAAQPGEQSRVATSASECWSSVPSNSWELP